MDADEGRARCPGFIRVLIVSSFYPASTRFQLEVAMVLPLWEILTGILCSVK